MGTKFRNQIIGAAIVNLTVELEQSPRIGGNGWENLNPNSPSMRLGHIRCHRNRHRDQRSLVETTGPTHAGEVGNDNLPGDAQPIPATADNAAPIEVFAIRAISTSKGDVIMVENDVRKCAVRRVRAALNERALPVARELSAINGHISRDIGDNPAGGALQICYVGMHSPLLVPGKLESVIVDLEVF